jgi:TonB family protein
MQTARNHDVYAAAGALALHVVVGYALVHAPRPAKASSVVEVDVRPQRPSTPVPSPETRDRPRPIAQPRRLSARRAPADAAPPANRAAPATPAKAPVRPVFGVTAESTTESESAMAVGVGNTTMIDPSKSARPSGPVAPLPAGRANGDTAQTARATRVTIQTPPEIDSEACGRTITYPSEAQQLGIEGAVRLRVNLDAEGRVREAKVLEGLGHGLDEAAVFALKHKCRFTPAIASDGKPIEYVISSYVFHFEIPR